jgi:hypothetical protein
MEDSKQPIGLDLSLASQDVIEVLIEDASEPDIFDEIVKANMERPAILRFIAEYPDTPDDTKKFIQGVLHLPDVQVQRKDAVRTGRTKEARAESLTQRIQKLTVSARIQLALKGGREIRGVLARDTNKEVMLSVLENGKITETEVEMIAQSRSSLEEALRRISKNREWMKKYAILYALVTNPKTPPGIAVTYVSEIKTKDLVIIEKNKNMADAIRSAAKRLLQWRKPK